MHVVKQNGRREAHFWIFDGPVPTQKATLDPGNPPPPSMTPYALLLPNVIKALRLFIKHHLSIQFNF